MTTQSTARKPLPSHWVKRIFAELQGNYGSRFLDMWRNGQYDEHGHDLGLVAAHVMWAEKLAGFVDHPGCLRRALDSLPTHPPTLPEFISLCRQQPREDQARLSAPVEYHPEVVERIAEVSQKMAEFSDDGLKWAKEPPSRTFAHVWESHLCAAALKCNRCREILREHVEAGVCKSLRATSIFERMSGQDGLD
jgi:hypothetical protein